VRLSASVFLAALCALASCQDTAYAPWPLEMVPGTVRQYSCRYTSRPPVINGLLEEDEWDSNQEAVVKNAWKNAPWSEAFLDIQGSNAPAPRYATWMKMLWDQKNLYIAAYIEEPDLWGTLDKRDMVMFHENDFEIFIDPMSDNNSYYEIECNVLGQVFDLYLTREYRKGGIAHHEWNCESMVTRSIWWGSLNDSTDKDRGWTIEIQIPFMCLRPPISVTDDEGENIRNGEVPLVGDQWRMNFSRVEWELEKVGAGYIKKPGVKENNWVWTPQWEVDMHQLEHWGVVTFTK